MTDTSKQLPLSYHQGYCYFDVNTGKFWIDTTNAAAGRMAINAYKADIATLANAAIYETTTEVNAPLHKINTYYGHGLSLNGTTLSLVAGDNNTTLSSITLPPDTHWTTHLYAGDGTAANKATTNGNTKITITDNNAIRNSVTIKGSGTTSVTSDANGVITINSADSKNGTVTKISTGAGLTGGDITGSGTIKVKLRSDTALTRDSVAATETANRVYPVVQDKSGYLAVNVPWTDNDHNTTYTLTQDALDGHKLTFTPSGGTAVTITIPDNNTTYTTAKYNYLGLMKPAYSSTGAASLTTAAASNSDTPTISARTTTAQRYYAIEVDKNGIPFVNVPWTDNNTWRGIQNNLTSSSTTDSLSAAMGKKLNDEKVAKAGDTMSGNLTVQKSTAEDTGFLINNTNKTQNLGFIVGSSGNAGLYSYTKSKWITYIDSAGNVQLNGNANTANKASAANITTTQNAIAKYSNTTGTFASSGVLIDNNNNLGVPGNITATGELNLTGNAYLHNETQADSLTAGSLLVTGNANFTQIPTAPTPASGSNDTSVATTAFVMNAFTANDAMVFKGVINSNSGLPATHKQGWTYKVGTAGQYAGVNCEVGDTIYCVEDGTSANNAHWAVVQANVDVPLYKDGNTFAGSKVLMSDGTGGKVKEGTIATQTVIKTATLSQGTLPTLGTAIAADDITAWDAGSTPTLGTAFSVPNVTGNTSVTASKVTKADVTVVTNVSQAASTSSVIATVADGVLTIAQAITAVGAVTKSTGTANTVSISDVSASKVTLGTAFSIPNVTGVGSIPSLSYTARTIPNVTGVGTLPSLSTTTQSVVTGIS